LSCFGTARFAHFLASFQKFFHHHDHVPYSHQFAVPYPLN
jgi:hypothetical protein